MKISWINIGSIEQSEFEKWFDQMSDKRKKEVASMKVEQKKKLRIAADALCRKTISDYCGIAPEEITFGYSEKGKPFAKDLPVHFSISHSGDYAVCAVSENEIGIDIEKIRPVNQRVADKFATEKEKEYILSSSNGFFEIWTLKEAYFKCIGTGLGKNIKDVSFEISDGIISCSKSGYEFFFNPINDNYICSICKKKAAHF